MSSSDSADTIVPDTEHRGLIARLPPLPRDLAQLARFDRPIGWWLLFWPCVAGVWLSGAGWQWALLAWLLLGSIAMRGAGCVYNDITDAELDRQVARTASRPIASGRVSKRTAWIWLAALSFVGLIVPHLVRPFTDSRPSQLIVPSALAGSLLGLVADSVVRILPLVTELRLGIALSLLGAPFFLWLLLRMRRGLA